MTVRISKPEFNLREKLSELDKPTGIKGNELMRSETPQDVFDRVGTGRKNMVINGDMRVSQRFGTSETTPSNNTYTLDQMRWDMSQSSKFKVQQVTDAPTGFSHSMKVTSLAATSPGSTDYFLVQNFIEGTNSARLKWGTSDAQDVTLSFYVKSSIRGVHACGIRNRAYNRSIAKNYIINQPDVWEYKTVTFPGCTDGTWETGVQAGLKINFDIGSGSSFEGPPGSWVAAPDFITSDSVKVVGTNGATWYITGIQLETGSLATPFEHRSFSEEIELCQRYYERHNWTSSQYVAASIQHDASPQNTSRFVFPFLTRKRTTDPSFTASGSYKGFPPNEAVTLTGAEDNDTSARVNVARTTSYAAGTGILILSDGHGNYFEINAEMPT